MKKEKYLEKILSLIKSEGLTFTMDQLAMRIGVTKKTLYNQFLSKDALIDECMSFITKELEESTKCMYDPTLPASEGLREGIMNMKRIMSELSHTFLRDLKQVYPDKAARDHWKGKSLCVERIQQNLERGIAIGEYAIGIDPERLAQYLFITIFGYFKANVMQNPAWAADDFFQEITEYHLKAIQTPLKKKTKK